MDAVLVVQRVTKAKDEGQSFTSLGGGVGGIKTLRIKRMINVSPVFPPYNMVEVKYVLVAKKNFKGYFPDISNT